MKNLAFYISLGIWTSVVLCSLWWNLYAVDANTRHTALNVGRSFFQEIEVTRLWNAGHGGVYVPITENTQPNPYLDVPDRDIRSTSGIDLTKINPAFMTRQISVLAEAEAGIRYHLTSLRPIRPQNKADEWETRALEQFEAGVPEILEFFPAKQEFRFMAPLDVKEACLPCHAKQGYRLGDVRGGISVTMPGIPYITSANTSKHILLAGHVVFWTAGMVGLFFFRKARENQIIMLDRKNHELRYEIDERKKAEQQLIQARDAARKAQRTAEEANAVKSTFLANVSHEVRTPMTAILGFTEILLSEIDAPDQREYLTTIQTSGHALVSLLNDILDLSKVEAQKLTLTLEPTRIQKVLTEIRDLLLPQFQMKGLNLSLETDPQLPAYLMLDRIRLKQILLNLIGNALKFTKKGGVTVTVRCEPQTLPERTSVPESEVTLYIDVADTGIGIPVERQCVIFEAFRQHEERANRKYGGTGIGLTLVQRLIELMAGSLHVESEIGQGSLFRISLPHVPVSRDAQYLPADSHADLEPQLEQPMIPSFTDNISAEAEKRVPEAVRDLEEHALPQWRTIHRLLIIGNVADFGRHLQQVAETFSLPGVSAYGQQLCEHAGQYNVAALETLLDAFPALLEELKTTV